VRLEDDIAAEAIKEAARAHVEAVLEKGIEATKKRTRVRDYSDVVKVSQPLLCSSLPVVERAPNGWNSMGMPQQAAFCSTSNVHACAQTVPTFLVVLLWPLSGREELSWTA
jgi:hypothetical protein